MLLQAEIVRIALTCLVFMTSLHLPIKIIVGWILDRLDCMPDAWPRRGPLFSKDTSECRTPEYSMYDKIGDTVLNSLILMASHRYYPNYTPLLLFLFILRLVGVIRYFKTHDKREFIYFPNIFITTALLLSILGKITPEVFFAICVYQIIQEVYMHGRTTTKTLERNKEETLD